MILSAFQDYASIFKEDQLDVFVPITPTVFALGKHNMRTPTSMEEYDSLPHVADLLDNASPMVIARHFLYTSLHQRHVTRMSYHEMLDSPPNVGQIVSYIRPPDDNYASLLQYAQLVTKYGTITLTLELNEEGEIPEDTAGVKIHFDSPSLKYVVLGEACDNPLFKHSGSIPNLVGSVEHVNELEFLLGNETVGITPITDRFN